VARQIPVEAVFEALGQVKYPGFSTDILALGIVEEVKPSNEGFVVVLRQASERDEVTQSLAASVRKALTDDLGVKVLDVQLRRVEAELGEKTGRVRLAGTRYVVAVASGKGGVGKSTVAANLAVALAQMGLKVGLLDADIYGPSMALMFGTGGERPKAGGPQNLYPLEKCGVRLMSMGFFLDERAPVIWRGPMVMGALRQFLKDTLWGTQDFLIVDLPPGTGDAQLTLAQQIALDGALIVTTPQDVSVLDATRAARMFRQVHCPLLGIVENMSFFVCPDCGERDEIFGRAGADRLAVDEGTAVLARIPLYPAICESADKGLPITFAQPRHPASQAYARLARSVLSMMPADS
jgi:ATP-binding protein involved in chromosome partitioning